MTGDIKKRILQRNGREMAKYNVKRLVGSEKGRAIE